uniref:Sex-regulated protein janus-B n=1 Tax=Amblyomma cajennense TaxID=34607 RepID=A0A023FQS9_AMBCJ
MPFATGLRVLSTLRSGLSNRRTSAVISARATQCYREAQVRQESSTSGSRRLLLTVIAAVASSPFCCAFPQGARFCRSLAMSENSFETIPDVKIDNGRYKYVLIKVHDKNDASRSKLIVRGSASAAYHADIYEKEMSKIESISGLETECLGGGRIIHNPDCAEIKVFGYSQGYGQADHSKAVEILKRNFPEYKSITWSNEGY